jgi:3'-phosphoadenosine 5'-phosphosulfate sulfotransferase (PAPS reductase)/FAD synthetase
MNLPLLAPTTDNTIASTPEVDGLLAAEAPVAIGVSGGKDSCAMAFALVEQLDGIGHAGPRILIHSDLGRTEWKDSLPTCERLAKATGVELVVVRRKAGDMLARWQGRWTNNVERYLTLSCVKLILPWSTPSMRFCTSELKMDVICAELVRRFGGRTILSASGIRADESANRAQAPVAKRQPKLCRASRKPVRITTGLDWHPILRWSVDDVWSLCRQRGFLMHEAYTRYGSSRVSCCFCILGNNGDLLAAAGCDDNHDLYRQMVALEAVSTFAFQGGEWLGDVAPHLLTAEILDGVRQAKEAGKRREAAEARIPKHLLYTKGWPTCVPAHEEAVLLASVRLAVATAVGLTPTFTDPDQIIARYEELMRMKAERN